MSQISIPMDVERGLLDDSPPVQKKGATQDGSEDDAYASSGY